MMRSTIFFLSLVLQNLRIDAFAPTLINHQSIREEASNYKIRAATLQPLTKRTKRRGNDVKYERTTRLNGIMDSFTQQFGKGKEEELAREERMVQVQTDYDVIIVGAGCSGIGTALMLTDPDFFGLDKSRVLLLERGSKVGESFRRWPEEMRFISPSFNQQGWTDSFDLNSISVKTSPAYSLHTEHPSGKEYAAYLDALAFTYDLNVRLDTEVMSIKDVGINVGSRKLPLFSVTTQKVNKKRDDKATDKDGFIIVDDEDTFDTDDDGFIVIDTTAEETLTSRYIIWAAGEFQYPKGQSSSSSSSQSQDEMPGADLCIHNSHVKSWAELPGDDHIIIGGYESGVDAAVNLAKAGKKCKVLASIYIYVLYYPYHCNVLIAE